MFLAKRLADGSTVYINRHTGKRAILSHVRTQWCAYHEGRLIQHGSRRGCIIRIEQQLNA